MKKIAVIGATGFVGKQVVKELESRGYSVDAIVRDVSKVDENNLVTGKSIDVNNINDLSAALVGNDAVISAYSAGFANPNFYDEFIKGSQNIEKAVENSGVKRFISVGGAGSLYVDGQQLVDGSDFPEDFKVFAIAARDYLNTLKNNNILDWTVFSPAIEMHPGTSGVRVGKYRTSLENPVFNENGRSFISVEDVAVALVDELEQNNHIKERFTAGY